MAASPVWKVYDASGKYQAACKEPEAAAALLGFYGVGASIRFDHRTLAFTADGVTELNSFDAVADLCYETVRKLRPAAYRFNYPTSVDLSEAAE